MNTYPTNNNETSNNTTTAKENTSMTGFDMDTLATLVAEQINKNINNVTTSVDGGQWAKGSKYYGKSFCGQVFNPYMVRWHLQKKYEELMDKYNNNVHRGITKEFDYMYSINYTLEEVRKLAMLEKRDKIAFEERKNMFDLHSCKMIFITYIGNIVQMYKNQVDKYARTHKAGYRMVLYVKGYGKIEVGVVKEKIVNHKIEKFMLTTREWNSFIDSFANKIKSIHSAFSYAKLYKEMVNMVKIKVPKNTKKSIQFMNCFIKGGAYYTLKQKIMFENLPLTMTYNYCSNTTLYGKDAIDKLRELVSNKKGYQIHGILKYSLGIYE